MSNPLAIAAVTATLRNLLLAGVGLDQNLAGTIVTIQPLDRARNNGTNANQLNLFLYHILPNGAWRNMDMPIRVRPGEVSQPPLGLNLYYLITAFGKDDDVAQPFSHELLGRAMSTLNDHPVLSADEIKTALPNNDLWLQVERVRITLQPFSVEEIAKLWTGFQTQYRTSVAYEVTVVLIESSRPVDAALPVLSRNVPSQTSLLPPYPTLQQIVPPNNQDTAKLGDVITLKGFNLAGRTVSVQFAHPLLATANVGQVRTATDTEITVQLNTAVAPGAPAPNDADLWPAGVYTVSATISIPQPKPAGGGNPPPDKLMTTNSVAMALCPAITKLSVKKQTKTNPASLSITLTPNIRPQQRFSVLVGSQELVVPPPASPPAPAPPPNPVSQAAVNLTGISSGTYFVRARVDGVDSQLVDRSKTPPQFDTSQQVKIP